MTAISFFVLGTPRPKARARVANGHAYTPAATREWENAVRIAYRQAYPGREPWPAGVALLMLVEVYVPGNGSDACIRGDASNFLKAVEDALNGMAYHDDVQLVDVTARKRRASKAHRPGVRVAIVEAQDET